MSNEPKACQNTDKELWRSKTEPGVDDYYAKHNLFVTENGAIGLCEVGHCIVMPPEQWFKLANTRAPSVDMEKVIAELGQLGDRAYCDYIDAAKKPECLGEEAKLFDGTFTTGELNAHRSASELLGFHRAYRYAQTILTRHLPGNKGASK